MKLINILKYHLLFLSLVLLIVSCNKENEWLDKKSDKGTVVPETLKDFQALLDNTNILNNNYSFIGNAGTDNLYVADENLGNLREHLRNVYSWDKEIVWLNGSSADWNFPFTVIACANLVIEGLDRIDKNSTEWNDLVGQAYFYRAFAYLNLSQIFCKPYSAITANTDLGLPIRLTPDVNITENRSTLEELYAQIISDAIIASELLDQDPKYIQRPSKPAANALLARIYLLMDEFEMAERYADEVLQTRNELIDFKDEQEISHSYEYKFPAQGRGNKEIIFYVFGGGSVFSQTWLGNSVQASTELYNLYDDDDLRKEYFFGNDGIRLNFVSNYTGTFNCFGGLSTNEILLIRAECYVRNGKPELALNDINHLLINRYKTNTFIDVNTYDSDELLAIILEERRKELPHHGNVRWEDLRRLNKDPRFQKTLSKTINGNVHSLPANDPRYILPIPENEILISGLEQNIR